MNIGFWFSDKGGSPLMGGLQRGLESLHHNVITAHPNGQYDFLIVFNQVAHTTEYQYPDWPHAQSPIAFVDAAEYGYFKRLPGIINCYANTFSEGSLDHDTKNRDQQLRLKSYLAGRSFPYFIREKSKFVNWPQGYYGIDYPLYHLSEYHTPPNREEYLSRSVPFWQSWGASHPWRWPITHALRDAGFECLVLEENGHPRLPQHDIYFPKMQSARAGLSFDGYGSSSFRRTEVLVRACLLEGPLSVNFPHPLTDGVNCIQFGIVSEGETFISTDVVEKLHEVIADPERAFSIYEAGFHHCYEYYSETATARYLLNVIEGHDYSKATPLDIT